MDMKGKGEQGFTLIELLIVVAIISIIAAIAVPGLLRARMTGNESSAIASLRTTTSSQVSYSAACGNGAYASSYDILADPPAAAPGSQGFISAEFNAAAPIAKSGYDLTLQGAAGSGAGANDCNNVATVDGFYASAVPQTVGTTGTRGFAVDTNMTIFQDTTGAAPGEPLTPGGNVAPIN
jgi:type IV pilus assembly protein PilA